MKFKSLLVAALAIVAFASCSKDNGGNAPTPGGESAVLNVTLTLPQTVNGHSRATNDSEGGFNDGNAVGEATRLVLENFAMFSLTTGGEILDVTTVSSVSFTDNKFETQFTTKNTAATIYLVGNYNGGDYSGLPGKGATLTALLNVLQDQTAIDQTTLAKNLIIAGVASVGAYTTPTPGSGDRWSASATITPIPVSTKLNITVNNKMKNYTGEAADQHYTITDVAVLYSAKQSRIFAPASELTTPTGVPYAAPYSANKYYLSGLDAWGGTNDTYFDVSATTLSVTWPTTFEASSFATTPGEQADQTFRHTFYVYPGAVNGDKSMIVVVRVESAAPGKDPMFYNIILNEANSMGSVSDNYKYPSNGRLYQITFNINADAATGTGAVIDPETELADIDVTVQPTDWVVVGGISETWD